jgi:chromosome segregation ATPase
MSTPVERFQELKNRREQLEKKRIELQTRLDTAKEVVQKGLAELKEKYGVGSLEEAAKSLGKMKDDLERKTTELDELLRSFETNGKSHDVSGV